MYSVLVDASLLCVFVRSCHDVGMKGEVISGPSGVGPFTEATPNCLRHYMCHRAVVCKYGVHTRQAKVCLGMDWGWEHGSVRGRAG